MKKASGFVKGPDILNITGVHLKADSTRCLEKLFYYELFNIFTRNMFV